MWAGWGWRQRGEMINTQITKEHCLHVGFQDLKKWRIQNVFRGSQKSRPEVQNLRERTDGMSEATAGCLTTWKLPEYPVHIGGVGGGGECEMKV